MRGYARELRNLGVGVTSRWLDETDSEHKTMDDVNEGEHAFLAYRDLADIDRADLLVFFSVDSTLPVVRGSRHVEFGYTLGCRKPILVIGPKENVFHCLHSVRTVGTWEEAKGVLMSGAI